MHTAKDLAAGGVAPTSAAAFAAEAIAARPAAATPAPVLGPRAEPRKVLLVDDDLGVLKAYARSLASSGYLVEKALSATEAEALLREHRFDAIVTDISMPGLDGIQLLRIIRKLDSEVPVILMTGNATLDTAIAALEGGAFRYLLKPVDLEQFLACIESAAETHDRARLRREAALHLMPEASRLGSDRADLERRFSRALATLWMAFQPIVSVPRRSVFAYEALVRCDEPTLSSPIQLFEAASKLGRIQDLGRAIRYGVALRMAEIPPESLVLVNLHAHELLDPNLYSTDAPLSAHSRRVIFEITERMALEEMRYVRSRIFALRSMGFGVALDDLGAGFAGLASFAQLEPDLVKIDSSLVRDVHLEPTKQRLIRSVVELCRELDVRLVAEGIEKREERDILMALGCEYLQGYLFGRPSRELGPLSLAGFSDG